MFKKMRKIFYRSFIDSGINYQTAQKNILKNNGIWLDVRSKQEFEEEHLPKAINISVYNLKEEAESKIPNKEEVIVTYCTSGVRSKQAKEILEQLGYRNVYNLKGGLNGIN